MSRSRFKIDAGWMDVCMYVCMCVYIYRHMAINTLRESSAKVAAKGKHFYAKVITFRRSQIRVILNNNHI